MVLRQCFLEIGFKMVVTVNTDASFSFKHKVGTYAYWVTCDDFKIKKSGVLRKKVDRSEIAEYRCIINAMHDTLTAQRKKHIKKIIINTDCLNVIHLFKHDKQKIKMYGLGSWGNYLTTRLELLLREHKIDRQIVEMRHVKSHEHTNTARNWVNQWCDDAAKFEISKILASLDNKA